MQSLPCSAHAQWTGAGCWLLAAGCWLLAVVLWLGKIKVERIGNLLGGEHGQQDHVSPSALHSGPVYFGHHRGMATPIRARFVLRSVMQRPTAISCNASSSRNVAR